MSMSQRILPQRAQPGGPKGGHRALHEIIGDSLGVRACLRGIDSHWRGTRIPYVGIRINGEAFNPLPFWLGGPLRGGCESMIWHRDQISMDDLANFGPRVFNLKLQVSMKCYLQNDASERSISYFCIILTLVFLLLLIKATIFSRGNITVNRNGIKQLLESDEIDDQVIDAYCYLLKEKAKAMPQNFSKFVYIPRSVVDMYKAHIASYQEYLAGIITREDLQNATFVISPCHTPNHWFLLAAEVATKKWIAYDSLTTHADHREAAEDQVGKEIGEESKAVAKDGKTIGKERARQSACALSFADENQRRERNDRGICEFIFIVL
ncbi:hypothetical protein KSP40_PGU008832 [Platanthera guangdongensis]|uniref:Ubiquitin-like protease family profile domain-containing protein n=1 Tax=Platanthera guangdongensis TaxID=2320717 RepID=A0ABR2N1U7_9ASPA